MAVEHAEVNIRLPGLFTGPGDINKSVVARNRTKHNPQSINRTNTASINVPNVSGQIIYQFNTSEMQWIDLFNSHFLTKFTLADGVGPSRGHWSHLTQNLISQAYLYINGVQVAFTNNWTVASTINKRIQFSKQYNESVNNLVYNSDATMAQSTPADAAALLALGQAYNGVGGINTYQIMQPGAYSDKEYLDGLFIRDRDSCWIPPNSEVKIILMIDPAGYVKSQRHGAAVINSTCLINTMEFVAYSVMKPGVPWITAAGSGGAEDIAEDTASADPDYVLRFITNSITSSASANTDCNRNVIVNKNITKLAIAFQQAPVVGADNIIGGENLAYATQNENTASTSIITGAAGAEQLNSLQVQLGSIVLPPQAYDFTVGGGLHREAYEDYMMLTGKTISYETQESFLDWLKNPIYLFDFPRPVSDISTNLIIRGTRTFAAVVPQMHIVEMDEQLVRFIYNRKTGACISTTTLI